MISVYTNKYDISIKIYISTDLDESNMSQRNVTDSRLTRRRILKTGAGLAAAGGFAGCSGQDSSGENTDSGTSTEGTSGGSAGEIEIVHRWNRGKDGRAMAALLEGFAQEHPDISVLENSVPANNDGLGTIIRDRMLNDDPPSTWQNWPGKALTEFVEADLLGDIEADVWDEAGLKDKYKSGPQRAAQVQGTYVTVPLNIHRLNPMFYNIDVVEQAGVDPTSINSPTALKEAMDKVESDTDAAGMSNSTKAGWTVLQLWETLLIATAGPDGYEDIVGGNAGNYQDAIQEALQLTADYSQYFTDDAGSIEWPAAARKVVSGEAAFFQHGDWAAGIFLSLDDFNYKEDWDFVAFPGTEGSYSVVMDSFPYPAPNRSPEASKKFLRYVGSTDAQERFNPIKGSIPPRTDVSLDPFSSYQADEIKSFRNSDAQPRAMAHGLALVPGAASDMKKIMSDFAANWDAGSVSDRVMDILSG
ncbi:ABC transporter substrate-binding protein [Halobellus ruber]|uniref:Carbohydrate ABC transporter substrate-binding protein n=1 Tax=Halobellus ruber TaxID=2761102 RepID=A0A7J9SLE3_9EURY|nr:ABC transporter substrate-binding protein [Halobellus ruber]MBB6647770.1 carbohydrate ABC transporter substrate-binding protein [Halobellus ruber]